MKTKVSGSVDTALLDPDFLQVRIVSSGENYYSGPALSVSSQNMAGRFDILPQHANFLTLIQNQPIIIRTPNGQSAAYNFSVALISATNNNVTIFSDIYQTPSLFPRKTLASSPSAPAPAP